MIFNMNMSYVVSRVTVKFAYGAIVTAEFNGSPMLTAQNTTGEYTFLIPAPGLWTFRAVAGLSDTTRTINIEVGHNYTLYLPSEPVFTYTGNMESGSPVIDSDGNWLIRFTSGGTLTFTQYSPAGIDVFLVGGGGGAGQDSGTPQYSGGGGGGYTQTHPEVRTALNTEYAIVIGAGGGVEADGGNSSAFGFSVAGGKHGSYARGGDGGSGGSSGNHIDNLTSMVGRSGGSDGGNGDLGYQNDYIPGGGWTDTELTAGGQAGIGQGSTTREFGEANGRLYSGGGGGHQAYGGDGGGGKGACSTSTSSLGTDNTGGGGGGGGADPRDHYSYGGYPSRAGGSGIVVIRNTRVAVVDN